MSLQKAEDNRKQQREEIMDKTRELLDLIMESEDYIRYQKANQIVKESGETYEKMNEFRRKNLALQLLGDENSSLTEMQDLYEEYKDILMDPLVSRFMMREQSICKLLRKVQDLLVHGIDIDTSYME